MNLKILLLGSIVVACTSEPERKNTHAPVKIPLEQKIINPEKPTYAVLSFDSSSHFIFPPTYHKTELTREEIYQCEMILSDYLRQYNQTQPVSSSIRLAEYGRQYIAALTPDKNKLVYINLFCASDGVEYKTRLIRVYDGGKCYFQVKVDLQTKKVLEFIINGVA